jgi:hypothetical protein
MKYVCKEKCFFRKRLWKPGEVLAQLGDEKLPKYFVKKGEEKLVKPVLKAEEPKTMSELHKAEGHADTMSKPGVMPAAAQAPVSPEVSEDPDFLE